MRQKPVEAIHFQDHYDDDDDVMRRMMIIKAMVMMMTKIMGIVTKSDG